MSSATAGFQLGSPTPREGGWIVSARVPAGGGLFEGHFPGAPVLPGISIVALVLFALDHAAGRRHKLQAIELLKLRRTTLPNETLQVDVARPDAAGRLRFTVTCAGQPTASGSMSVQYA